MIRTSRWAVRLAKPPKNTSVRTASSSRPPKSHSLQYQPKAFRPTTNSRLIPTSSRHNASQSNQLEKTSEQATKAEALSTALLQTAQSEDNDLLTPVSIPKDPYGILQDSHPAMGILANSSIIIRRQLEMMNVFLGFEQANRYVIMDPQGNTIGYLAEMDHGVGKAVARQAFKTHRSFTTHVFDREEREVLRFHRPFAWISSRIRVYDAVNRDENAVPETSTALQGTSVGLAAQTQLSSLPLSEMRIIGEAQQQWAPLRRKYNLFLHRETSDHPDTKDAELKQWAYCDEPFLSWDFSLLAADKTLIGSVNRSFSGFAREIFTDTGVYALRMDAAGLAQEPNHLISQTGKDGTSTDVATTSPGMTLDQRAVMLATAVSIDFDYFSRHSSSSPMGIMPLWLPWGGGAAEAGAAGAAGVGAAEGATGVAGEVAGAARNTAIGEGAITGAGTMAGYEAMKGWQGGANSNRPDDASPQAPAEPWSGGDQPQQTGTGDEEDVWGQWGGNDQQSGSGSGDGFGGGSSGGGGGGDGGSWFDDFL
ncbi:Scramblase-domain-containing protein [Tothia fuscella]|uniref:Scramblase-domain-containing protein n=1 Tax=Tothia fuscella TaxID=1048955 RepID=A0A9P4P548_9PEZI|nr:Scramblase-domain-containing protein [Tothia fuscella]